MENPPHPRLRSSGCKSRERLGNRGWVQYNGPQRGTTGFRRSRRLFLPAEGLLGNVHDHSRVGVRIPAHVEQEGRGGSNQGMGVAQPAPSETGFTGDLTSAPLEEVLQ